MNLFDATKAEVADKVRKLLAKAENPAATPEEAQSYTAKAQQMMSKYSISLAMISDVSSPDALVTRSWTVEGPYAGHKVSLIAAIARANDCRVIYGHLPQGRKHVEAIGYGMDLEWVETLFRSLEIQLNTSLASALRKEKPVNVHGRTYATAFVMGFTAEVASRLKKARQDAVTETEAESPTASNQLALVLVAKSQRVDDEFRVRHPYARTVYSQVRLQSWAGYAPGRQAGQRASLARGSLGGGRRRLR